VFGEHDASTPTSVVVPRLRDALGRDANQIVVLPAVGHTVLLEERGADFDSLRVGTFAPAFLAIMDNWIRRWLAPQGHGTRCELQSSSLSRKAFLAKALSALLLKPCA
jgi:hypothetical protein